MKSLIKFYLIALCLSLTLFDCNEKKPDDDVIITYQHLANFPTWSLNGGGSKVPNLMWHAYMLRGIVNKGKDAQPFLFELKKLSTKDGATLDPTGPMVKAAPVTIPPDFHVLVNPQVGKQDPYTVPFGTGTVFFIQDKDPEPTAFTRLFYRTVGADGKPKIQEGVIMHMLDPKAKVLFGNLDQDFLDTIHGRQNEFENKYDSAGNKL